MKNKNLVIILSHCDTQEKIDILRKNILKLKIHKFDILLSSHIPVPSSIIKKTEYFLYDKSNPILHWPNRGMTYWKTLTTNSEKLKLVNILPDYGWTAFNQILATSHLGLSLDYTHYSFINYDVMLTHSMVQSMKSPEDFICSKVYESKNKQGFRFPSFMFNILNKENLKKLLPLISKEQYISGSNQVPPYNFKDAEHYLGHLISIFNYQIFPEIIKDQIEYGDKNPFNFNKNDDLFKLFFQSIKDSNIYKTKPSILLYDIQKEFKLIINDQEFLIKPSSYRIEYNDIKKFGYYRDNSYIDLTHIFEEKRQTSIDIND